MEAFAQHLRTESSRWQADGIISSEQQAQILLLYKETKHRSSQVSFAVSALGVLLFGAAILLVVSYNWSDWSRLVRMGVMVLGLAALHITGNVYVMHHQTSVLWHLLGCIAFGGAIALTAQMFHVGSPPHYAVLVWCLGTIPFAVVMNSGPMHALSIALACVWLCVKVSLTDFRTTALSETVFVLLVLPTAIAAYRSARVWLVTLCVAAYVVLASFYAIRTEHYLLVSVVPLFIAAAHEDNDPLASPWRLLGSAVVAFLSCLFGAMNSHIALAQTNIMGSQREIAIGFAVLIGAMRRTPSAIVECVLAAAVVVVPVAATHSRTNYQLIALLMNAVTIVLSVNLVQQGLESGRLVQFQLGTVTFLAWLVVRYIDLGAWLGMLGTAAAFAIVGSLLFGMAYLWRTHKGAPLATSTTSPSAEVVSSWIARPLARMRHWKLALLWIGTVGKIVVLGWMVCNHSLPLLFGTRVLVPCRPVDPRDLLMGDFVRLSYDFSRTPQALVESLYKRYTMSEGAVFDVYVPIDLVGGVATPGTLTLDKPAGLYLAGTIDAARSVHTATFGIEKFFVQEGTGLEWERAREKGVLLAELVVLPNGRSSVAHLVRNDRELSTTEL